MSAVMTLNAIVVAFNALLATGLVVLYARMLREVPTRFTVGLLAFASLLLVQSGVQLYFFATMMQYYAGGVEGLVLVQNLLAAAALGWLTFVTAAPVGRAPPAPESGKTPE